MERIVKKWTGTEPDKCDICKEDLDGIFFDGMINDGTPNPPWAIMCSSCHNKHGMGLCEGYGQLYDLETRELISGGMSIEDEYDY